MRSMVRPEMCGKRLQRIDEDKNAGFVYVHTAHGVLTIEGRVLGYETRQPKPEPIVVTGKSAK